MIFYKALKELKPFIDKYYSELIDHTSVLKNPLSKKCGTVLELTASESPKIILRFYCGTLFIHL